MPTDPSTAPANATSRRTFLTRTALGGALASAGALAAPALAAASSAHGHDNSSPPMDDSHYAYFGGPLELAAVQVYQSALENKIVASGSDTFTTLQSIQNNHQAAADAIATVIPTTAAAAAPAQGFYDSLGPEVKAAGSITTLLNALAGMENELSATHLRALETIDDAVTAKMAAQILAAEAQTAAALGLTAGTPVATLTPAVDAPTGGLDPGAVAGAPAPTTTTTVAN